LNPSDNGGSVPARSIENVSGALICCAADSPLSVCLSPTVFASAVDAIPKTASKSACSFGVSTSASSSSFLARPSRSVFLIVTHAIGAPPGDSRGSIYQLAPPVKDTSSVFFGCKSDVL